MLYAYGSFGPLLLLVALAVWIIVLELNLAVLAVIMQYYFRKIISIADILMINNRGTLFSGIACILPLSCTLMCYICELNNVHLYPFNAVTLLVGHLKRHLPCISCKGGGAILWWCSLGIVHLLCQYHSQVIGLEKLVIG